MKITSSLAAMSLTILAAACGGENPEPTTPATTEAVTPPPPVEAPKADPKPVEPPPPAKLEALTKPESTWTIGGKSVSKATGDEALAAAKKAGLVKGDATATPSVAGQYESMSFPIEKGKMKGTVKVVRPAATPGAPESAASAPNPSKLGDSMNKDTSAFYYDAEGDVFVGVEVSEGGKAADAKKALDAIAKPGKAAPAAKGGTTTAANPGKDSDKVPPAPKGATGTTAPKK